ncbi:MAG: peptidoglycan DD-metalloendopeptidase family protein [Brotaphodocola sp.]
MKEKINQMFKDKLFLVMLVLGLLTIVAAAGVVTIQRGNGQQENPYLDMQGQEKLLAEDEDLSLAGTSNANEEWVALEEQNAGTGESDRVTSGSDVTSGQNLQSVGEYVAEETSEIQAEAVGAGLDAATALVLDFSETSKITWPHRGNIVLDYSMDSTIYFPTLEQYKCNPGLVIQADISEPVYAPANARVMETGMNEEIGNFVVLDLGNEYSAVCGQLKEIPVCEGEYLEKGQLLGYVAEPTKYYTIEGSNVYFQMKHQEKAVDPLDYLE